MKLKTNPVKLLALFVLLFVFLGVVFIGADGNFGVDGLSDRAREAFKRIPISRDVETRESSRDRGRDRGREENEEAETDPPIGADLEDKWWCEDFTVDEGSGSDGGGEEVDGESDPSGSGYKFIDPSKFSKFKIDPSIIKNWDKIVYVDTVAHEGGIDVVVPPKDDDWVPEFKPGYEDDSIELDEPLRCWCLGEVQDIEWVNESIYYGEFAGDEDAYCEYLFPDKYCANPVDISCSCENSDGESYDDDYVISEEIFEEYYNSDSDMVCDDFNPPFWCDPAEWGCPDGEPNVELIGDMCDDAWTEMYKAATAGICGDGLEPNVTSDLIDLCTAKNGPGWGTFDYMEDYMCISFEDCLEYYSWYEDGYYTSMIEATFGEDAGGEYLQSCSMLYGDAL
jgi:hypothetical protein